MERLLILFAIVVTAVPEARAQGWQGIVPMRSTMEDVARVLGPAAAMAPGRAAFSFADKVVHIEFAHSLTSRLKCERDVPEGTVLSIRVTPSSPPSVRDLRRKLTGLQRFVSQDEFFEGYEIYFDDRNGVVAQVSEGRAEWILYIAPARYRNRCSGLYRSDPLDYLDVPHQEHPVPVCTEIKADRVKVAVGEQIGLTAIASDPDADILQYRWTATGGHMVGTGASVMWDTTGLEPGAYTITAQVEDGSGHVVDFSVTIKVEPRP